MHDIHEQAEVAIAQMAQATSLSDICRDWKSKYRRIAEMIQMACGFVFPAGAKFMGLLIPMIDNFCTPPQPMAEDEKA